MRFPRLILFVICCGLWIAPARAADTYIQPQNLSPLLLPPPPAEGSAAWRQQADQVLAAQHHLSAPEIDAIRDEQNMRIDLMTGVLGPDFTCEKLPKTFALLDRVRETVHEVSEADKTYWNTRRPYLTDPKITLYVDRIDQSPSFPSGHTATSRTLAEVLGMLVPDKRAELRAQADLIAHRRIEAGAHFPGDIEGGRLLAMQMIGYLMADDDFQDDLTDARHELAAQKSQ